MADVPDPLLGGYLATACNAACDKKGIGWGYADKVILRLDQLFHYYR
jgi:hypothetical protein